MCRWTPSRALSYGRLFERLVGEALFGGLDGNGVSGGGAAKRVLCIGGGAGAEIVGLGALSLLVGSNDNSSRKIHVTAVDLAEWGPVVARISDYMNENWGGSLQRQHQPIDQQMAGLNLEGDSFSSPFTVNFINHDILTLSQDQLDISRLDLITSMFTTNELFAASKTGTVNFLHSLSACHSGALLLFVESAGSYSEVTVGTKVFPVHFLIHHVLSQNNHWELVSSSDSQWYRLPEGLSYPMQLENMRYFFRLYRRT